LTTKKDINDNTAWNLNELLQASLIIIHYHKLCLIVESLKINLFDENEKDLKIEENKESNSDMKKKLINNLENFEDDIEFDKGKN